MHIVQRIAQHQNYHCRVLARAPTEITISVWQPYRLVERNQQLSNTAKLSPYRVVPLNGDRGLFVGSIPVMTTISHEIEDIILQQNLRVDLFVGFQQFSNVYPQRQRYERLGRICHTVHVWGVPDTSPPDIPGVTYHPLHPDDSVAREWFVVVDSSHFFTALLAKEVTEQHRVTNGGRVFEGIWTHDADLVSQSTMLLHQMIGDNYEVTVDRDYTSQFHHIAQILIRLVGSREELIQRLTTSGSNQLHFLQESMAASDTPLLLLDLQKQVIAATRAACNILDEEPKAIIDKPIEACGNGLFADRDPTLVIEPLKALLKVSGDQLLTASSQPVYNDMHHQIGWVISLHQTLHRRTRVARRELPVLGSLQPDCQQLKQHLDNLADQVADNERATQTVVETQELVQILQHKVARLALLHHVEAQGEVAGAEVDLRLLIQQVLQEWYIEIRRQGILFGLEIPPDLPPVWCDASQLHTALSELLSNLVQHAAGVRKGRLQVYQADDHIYLGVQDFGDGIQPEDHDRVFRPLPRSGMALPEATEHVGLGLAIVRAIAKAHHGYLQIESQPGKGSTFTIMLPLASQASKANHRPITDERHSLQVPT